MNHPISKEQAVQLAREAGVVDGPKILMMATPDELHRFAQAAFKLGRNSGLEEAAKVCTELAELNRKAMTDSMWQQEECASAIESLKEPTP